MNLSVANHNTIYPNSYAHYPSIEFTDIPEIVKAGYSYCAAKLRDEYRKDENFEGYVDVLILDIDDGCSLIDARKIFRKFEYYMITTKSHQRLKNDVVCDRFRLFLYLDETIMNANAYRRLIEYVFVSYPFIDQQTKDISRFFHSSPKDAIVVYNEGKRYKTNKVSLPTEDIERQPQSIVEAKKQDIQHHTTWLGVLTQDTFVWDEIREEFIDGFNNILEHSGGDSDEENHLIGIQNFLDTEYYPGQRATTLFKASSMLIKDGFSEDFIVDYLLREFNKRGGKQLSVAKQNILSAFKYNK